MKQIKIIFLIIGTIIGAGFISGKEVFEFFSKFGYYSYLVILPMFFCLYYFITKLLLIGANNKINNIEKLNLIIFKKDNKIIKVFTFLSFIILSSTMISAINTSFNVEWFSPKHFLNLALLLVISCIVLHYDISSLLNICGFLLPMVLCVLIIVCFANFNSPTNIILNSIVLMPYNALNYVCRNVFLSYFVIAKSSFGLNTKQCKRIGFFASVILCLVMIFIITCELCNHKALDYPMPLLFLASKNNILYIIYFCCIQVAILTTLFSTLVTLKSFFHFKKNITNIILPILICIVLSLIKFDTFVSILYPIVGILGFYFCYALTFSNLSLQNPNKHIHNACNKTQNKST